MLSISASAVKVFACRGSVLLSLVCTLPPAPVQAGNAVAAKQHAGSEKPVSWSEKQKNGHVAIKSRVLISASASTIWKAMHEECNRDPDVVHRTVISHQDNEEVLDEELGGLPLLGTANCRIHRVEIACQRMDYRMISSDKLKALEGSWELTPGPNSRSNFLVLSSYCDVGIPVPRILKEIVTAHKLEARLAMVKKAAETAQVDCAAFNSVR